MLIVLVNIAFMFIFLVCLRKKLLDKSVELDVGAVTPSDFCVMGRNIEFEDDQYSPD